VTLRTSIALIGFVSLNGDPDLAPVHYDIGYRFNERFHGQGYATEACQAVMEYAFETLGADAVVAGTAEANGPSRALLGRLSLRETRRSTASFRTLPDGSPDEFVGLSYALMREEWEAGRAEAAHKDQA
jgi:RimJ/RimL family protein N-acetyltransferase